MQDKNEDGGLRTIMRDKNVDTHISHQQYYLQLFSNITERKQPTPTFPTNITNRFETRRSRNVRSTVPSFA